MKKSKIIVPALAMIGLSAVASVTGSVAWFTAQRTGNINTEEFAVVKADGALDVHILAGGIGTNKTSDTVISPKTNAKSVDVSFNPATKDLWTDNDDGIGASFVKLDNGSTEHNYDQAEAAANHYVVSVDDKVYQAFTWQVEISYTWGADFTQQNIFFDYSDPTGTGSKMTGKSSNGTEISSSTISTDISGATYTHSCEGFRVAILGSTQTIVFADLQVAANLKTVTATNASGLYSATSGNYSYFASDKFGKANTEGAAKNTYVKANNNTASQTTREDYVGSITHSDETDNLTFWCVAWYEGTDPSINNNAALEKVATKLSFYAATNK